MALGTAEVDELAGVSFVVAPRYVSATAGGEAKGFFAGGPCGAQAGKDRVEVEVAKRLHVDGIEGQRGAQGTGLVPIGSPRKSAIFAHVGAFVIAGVIV